MKKILNIKFFSAILLASIFTSCDNKDDATGYSNLEVSSDVVGTISLVSPLTTSQIVREADAQVFTYKVTLNKPQSVDTHISVVQTDGTATAESDFKFDSDIVIPAYATTANGTISILNDNSQESNETFTLKIGNINTSNATVASSVLNFTIKDCFSNLAGTFNYVTTNCYTPGPPAGNAAGPFSGTVTFTQSASGVYDISDASFGGWIGLYGSGVATGVKLLDLCGTISFTGQDQFNEVFTMSNLVINGASLSFHWANDYGEYGDTTLTRTDGTNWPSLSL